MARKFRGKSKNAPEDLWLGGELALLISLGGNDIPPALNSFADTRAVLNLPFMTDSNLRSILNGVIRN